MENTPKGKQLRKAETQKRFQRSNSRVFKNDSRLNSPNLMPISHHRQPFMVVSSIVNSTENKNNPKGTLSNPNEVIQFQNCNHYLNDNIPLETSRTNTEGPSQDEKIGKFIRVDTERGELSRKDSSFQNFASAFASPKNMPKQKKSCLNLGFQYRSNENKKNNSSLLTNFKSILNQKKNLEQSMEISEKQLEQGQFHKKKRKEEPGKQNILGDYSKLDLDLKKVQAEEPCPTKRKQVVKGYQKFTSFFAKANEEAKAEKVTRKIIHYDLNPPAKTRNYQNKTDDNNLNRERGTHKKMERVATINIEEEDQKQTKLIHYAKENDTLKSQNKQLSSKNKLMQEQIRTLTGKIQLLQQKINSLPAIKLKQYSNKVQRLQEQEKSFILDEIKMIQSFKQISQQTIILDLKKQIDEISRISDSAKEDGFNNNIDHIVKNLYQENSGLKEQIENLNLQIWAMECKKSSKFMNEEKMRKLELENRYTKATLKESSVLIDKLKSENDRLRKQNRQQKNKFPSMNKILDSSSLSLSFSLC